MSLSAATHAYQVEAHTRGNGIAEAVTKGSRIRFDASAEQGADLPGPADLLTTAFAACILKNVERFSRILPFHYHAARIHVTSERQDAPPRMTRIRYALTVVTDEDPRKVELLHRNIKLHGTIYNTLAAACDVDGEITVRPSSDAAVREEM